jgi:radical SAM protein with 4Fe4S-binding SPASM domain
MRAMLTTSGYFMKKHSSETLFHPAVKQINISLNSFNKNDTAISFEQYMRPILNFCQEKVKRKEESFINLRMWNLDEVMSEESFNRELFTVFNHAFNADLTLDNLNPKEKKSIRLDYKVLLHFDNYFEWPSLSNPNYGHGSCQGLSSHIGILSDGRVVPCCLDNDAVMELGNLKSQSSLKEILFQNRAVSMRESFKKNLCSEEMCLKCSYKSRFN